jgi:hypothetical protein
MAIQLGSGQAPQIEVVAPHFLCVLRSPPVELPGDYSELSHGELSCNFAGRASKELDPTDSGGEPGVGELAAAPACTAPGAGAGPGTAL